MSFKKPSVLVLAAIIAFCHGVWAQSNDLAANDAALLTQITEALQLKKELSALREELKAAEQNQVDGKFYMGVGAFAAITGGTGFIWSGVASPKKTAKTGYPKGAILVAATSLSFLGLYIIEKGRVELELQEENIPRLIDLVEDVTAELEDRQSRLCEIIELTEEHNDALDDLCGL